MTKTEEKRGHIIGVVNEKGGVGKTNTVISIATAAAMTGKDVLIVDTDPQGSATMWAATRLANSHLPQITSVVKSGDFRADVQKLATKFDVVVIDSGGRDSLEMRYTMAASDFTLIPVVASQFDTWSLARVAKMIQDVNEQTALAPTPSPVNAYCFINNAPTNNKHEVEDCQELLKELESDFPDLGLVIYNRIAHRKAARLGIGAMELPKLDEEKKNLFDPKAALEIAHLYQIAFGKMWEPAEAYYQPHHKPVLEELKRITMEANAA